MRSAARVILMLFFATILLSQYQNCSSSSDNTLFQSGNLDTSSTATTGTSDPGKPTIAVSTLVNPLRAAPSENQISIAGTCNPGGRVYNYIEYSVMDSVSRRVLDLNASGASPAYSLRDAICENGRFYIVLPITAGSGGPDPAQSSYLLNVDFYISNDSTKFEPKISTSASLIID